MRSTRHLKNRSMGRNERVTYSRPSRTRARPLLAPVVHSCPRGAPTRPLPLLVPARFSYSPATPTRLATRSFCGSLPLRGEVRARRLPLRGEPRAPPGRGHYPGCEHPRARALPGVRSRAPPVLLVPLPVYSMCSYPCLCLRRACSPDVRPRPAAWRRGCEERRAWSAGHAIAQMGHTHKRYARARHLALCAPEPVGCRPSVSRPPPCAPVRAREPNGARCNREPKNRC